MQESQLAINTVSLSGDFEDVLDGCAEAGFRYVELALRALRPRSAQDHSWEHVVELLGRKGLQCVGGFEAHLEAFSPPDQRRTNHALHVENAQRLGALGARTMVVGTDGPTDLGSVADPLGDIAKAVGEVARRIEEYGVTICVEFNWGPLVKSMRSATEIARRSGAKNVGVLFDPAHYHCTPTKLEMINAENVPYIRHVHVDDMRDKPAELSDCNSDRTLPGEGCLDLKSIFERLERFGYDGFFSIEMFSDELWAMPPVDAARKMYESLLPLCGDGS